MYVKNMQMPAVLKKVKNVLNKSSLYVLNNSLFIPYLAYCIEVWGNTYKTNIRPLILRQKKAIPFVNKAKYLEHTYALFKTLNTLFLFLLIKLTTNIFMHKIYYRKMPLCILDYFTYSTNVYNTRQCDKCYS